MVFMNGKPKPGCGGCGQSPVTSGPGRPLFSVPVPGLTQPVGSGSVVASLLSRVGVQPCGGCRQRKEKMNRAVGFRPVGWV